MDSADEVAYIVTEAEEVAEVETDTGTRREEEAVEALTMSVDNSEVFATEVGGMYLVFEVPQ